MNEQMNEMMERMSENVMWMQNSQMMTAPDQIMNFRYYFRMTKGNLNFQQNRFETIIRNIVKMDDI